jgi:putative membrane protein
MLLKQNIRLGEVISGTWKNMVFSVITCTFAYQINEIWLSKYFDFPTFVPALIGTALAFFIGFNNNQAYSRWWEARVVWGSLVNNSRSWTRQILFNTESTTDATLKIAMVKRHLAFIYALKAYLRNETDSYYTLFLSGSDLNQTSSQMNIPNAILSLQSRDLQKLSDDKAIDGFRFMELNKLITEFCDDMGRSERIRNTVFPTTYTYYSKNFIWIFIYAVTMAIGSAIGMWAIVFGTITGYIFFTIQSLGQTLVNPFERSPSALPLDQIARTIEINLLQMLGEKEIPKPVESVNGEYIL